ncbi:terminase large subunit [Rheinheimera sp.]|uniref:terminase large subunit n=1 Tax=Rheinheimera sp. TaxID=1869214 RepID=UPI0027361E8F|nr:terminase large subunit [Rheinheimera sp.]MDP2715531.1 terminase large subunit [Rheinheimera sp.]
MAKVERYPHVNRASKYARDILAGRIPACKYVRLACERYLVDLEQQSKKVFKYRFDKDKAERACRFIEKLPHTKGEWAFRGEKLKLEPWQSFIVANAFGWVRKKGGKRRYREVYTEVPRKNGKSAVSSGVAVYTFAADNEFGAEVYSGATTEKQAWEVFRPAKLMCSRTPDLLAHFGIEVNASTISKPADAGRLEPVIGKPGDGASPSCAIIDEYHEHDTSDLYDTMLTGMGARAQPLLWIITTAGANIEGPCYDKRRGVIEMLEGITPDDELFGIIFTIDADDDWTDPAVLRKANPNMGVSVHEDYLLSQQQRAIKNARFTNTFKTKHLNVWVSAKTAFFNLESWKACEDRTLDIGSFAGQECIIANDLASKLDLTAMVPLFWRDICGKRHYYCIGSKFFIPYDTVYSSDDQKLAQRYQKWANTGSIIVTDGAEINFKDVMEEILNFHREAPVREVPLDPHGATALAHDLEGEGLLPVNIPQNYTHMSEPMKELEAAIQSGRFHHDGNPILTWCIGNVVAQVTPDEKMMRPVKEKRGSVNKIDGAVALIMAISRAMANEDGGLDFSKLNVEDLLL